MIEVTNLSSITETESFHVDGLEKHTAPHRSMCPRLISRDPKIGPHPRPQLANVEQRVVYSIYYNGTLVLPWRGERGVALAGCVWVRVE